MEDSWELVDSYAELAVAAAEFGYALAALGQEVDNTPEGDIELDN